MIEKAENAAETRARDSIPAVAVVPSRFRSGEFWGITLLLAAFLLINLATASRSPTVWEDEAFLSDPAVTAYFGHGFHSGGFYHESKEATAAYNGMAYDGALFIWMKIVGFGPVAVRSLNYFLMVPTIVMTCAAARRFGLVPTAAGRLVLAAVLMSGFAVTFSYRSGRYDIMGMAESAAIFFVLTLRRPGLKYSILIFLGALAVWTGLQLIPYFLAMGFFLLFFCGRRTLAPMISLFIGIAIGAASLYIVVASEGNWQAFVKVTQDQRTLRFDEDAHIPLARRMVESVIDAAEAPVAVDVSLAPLLVILAAGAIHLGRHRADSDPMKTKSLVTFGLSVGLLLPFLMMTAGHYPRYYAWMTFLPVTIATVGVWDAWLRSSHSRLLRWGSGAMLAMACAMGLPARVALTAMEWDSRDYGRIERIVQPQVRADDWAVIDYSAYYAVKPIAQWTFLPPYLARITEQERSRVSLLVIHPEDFASVSMRIGGQWTEAASVQSESPAMAFWLRRHVGAEMYSLAVYRRASESPH